MGHQDFDRLQAKAKMLGVKYKNLNNSGLVIHTSDSEDLLYLPYRDKPIKISKDICIPEYLGINSIVIVRYAKKTNFDGYRTYIKLYFPHCNRQMTLEEIHYLSSYIFSGVRLPGCCYSVSSSDECGAIILKIRTPNYNFRAITEKTYIISSIGYRKQISNKYVCVANAGWDADYNRKFVLLQIGRSANQFENIDNLHQTDRIYLDNNYINSTFTEYKLLSPSNRIVTRNSEN